MVRTEMAMFTVVLEIYNRFNEVEERKSFHSETLRGAAIACGKYMRSEWGSEVETFNVTKRKSTVSDTMYFWEVR